MDLTSIVLMVVFGSIAIGYPIILLLELQNLPQYITCLYVIWIILSIIVVAMPIGEKWYNKLLVLATFTLVFTVFLVDAGSISDSYMDEKDKGMLIIAPAMNIPALYIVGLFIREGIRGYREQKKADLIHSIESKIEPYAQEIQEIETQLNKKSNVNHIVELLCLCDKTAETIAENPAVSDIHELEKKKHDLQNQIKLLNEEIDKIGRPEKEVTKEEK